MYLSPDDEGYAPAKDQFMEGAVWMVPEIERDPEKLGWGLCQVKGDPRLAPIEDKEFCGDNGEELHGNYWVVPVMWLMPSQTPKGKDDIALDTFVRNHRKHTTSHKGWDTIFARSMSTLISVKKSGAGYRVHEANRDLIRGTHEKAQESAPLQIPAQVEQGKTAHQGRKKKAQEIPRARKGTEPRSAPASTTIATGSRKRTRGGSNPAYDEARRQEIYDNLRSVDGLPWDKAWDKSLEVVLGEMDPHDQ